MKPSGMQLIQCFSEDARGGMEFLENYEIITVTSFFSITKTSNNDLIIIYTVS